MEMMNITSGEPITLTPEYWEAKTRRLTERFARTNGSKS